MSNNQGFGGNQNMGGYGQNDQSNFGGMGGGFQQQQGFPQQQEAAAGGDIVTPFDF